MGSCCISLVVKNALLREGLCRILSENAFEIKRSIGDVKDLDITADDEDHIVILDQNLDGNRPIGEITSLIGRFRRSKSVVLAEKFDVELVVKCFSAGACGYILNDVPYQTFVAMMQLVSMGETVVPSQFVASISRWDLVDRDWPEENSAYTDIDLTERDVKILRGLSVGLSNKMISRELGVSEATVKGSVKNLFRKLSVSNRTQAAMVARQINLSPKQDRECAPLAYEAALRTDRTMDGV